MVHLQVGLDLSVYAIAMAEYSADAGHEGEQPASDHS